MAEVWIYKRLRNQFDDFDARGGAGFDFDVGFSNVEVVGEEFDESGISFAVMSAGAETYDICAVGLFFYFIALFAAGLDFGGNNHTKR